MKGGNYRLRQQNHATYISLTINIDKNESLELLQKETREKKKLAKHYTFLDLSGRP